MAESAKLDPMPKTWTAAVLAFRRWRLEAAAQRLNSTNGVPAHSKSEHKRRVALGDPGTVSSPVEAWPKP